MKCNLLILLLTLISYTLPGQTNDIWTAFWNKDTTLIGYKDKNNAIKIEPRFTGISNAGKFENIIGVVEEIDGRYVSYYLTKTERKIGKDSLYILDFSVDCENEGFIRFRDAKTDKAGMLNRNGDIVIPAEYNDLTRVKNGVVVGLKGAEKECCHKNEGVNCELFCWIGGQEILIDTLNNVITDNFTYDNNLNFFTLKKTNVPVPDTIRTSFLAKDGSYYSFVDVEKEFKQWLMTDLFTNLTSGKLINNSYDTIVWWTSTDSWGKTDRRKFVTDNFSVLKRGLLEVLNPECDFFISKVGLAPDINNKIFEQYYNNCGEYKHWIYPVLVIVISHENKGDYLQDHYEFLRTDNGYKLISVAIRSEKIK